MKLKNKLLIFLIFLFANIAYGSENFFADAKKQFEKKNIDKAKFLFQRNIVFNPKHAKSYLYLAKIYKIEENDFEIEKNLKTTLLLESDNEEAMFMMMDIEMKKSNFSRVIELKLDFEKICSTMCEKLTSINDRLKNFDNPDES